MNTIFNNFYNEYLELYPDLGTFQQLKEFNNRYGNRSIFNNNFKKLFESYLKKIKKNNNIYTKVFRYYLINELKLIKYNNSFPFEPYNSHILQFISLCKGNGYQKLNNTNDFLDFMNKTNEYCNFLNNCIDEMFYMSENKIVLPKLVCKILIKQIDNIIINKEYLPVVPIPIAIKKYYLNFMNTFFKNKLIEVNNFLKNDYIKLCRNTIGIYDTPKGIEYYKQLIYYSTSFNISPNEIHNIGLKEIDRIQNEIKNLIKIYFPNKSNLELLQFFKYIRNDKSIKIKSKKELIKIVKNKQQLVENNYKNYFNEKLKHKVLIKEIPKHLEKISPIAFEEIPSYNFKKPSTYYINTSFYNKISEYDILPLTLHESIPGHHFQLSYHIQEKIPKFMIYLYNNTSYIEGWALYTESLYPYDNKYEIYSKLNQELIRAIRLVLDTGINVFKWNYKKSFDFYKQNSSLSDKEIKNEILRFICNPSQSINYKIGEIFFKKYVSKFDNLKDAHSSILKNGPVPLCFLDKTIFKCYKYNKLKTKRKIKRKKKYSKKNKKN